MHSELNAVLFDMDGTLVDTEPMWMQSELAMAEEYNADWTVEDGLQMVGRSLLDSAFYIQERMNLPLSPEAIVDRMVNHMVDELSRNIPWRPGALEVLHELADAGIKLALVTMSYSALSTIVAKEAGIFSSIISGDVVKRGKPFPDPYLQAASELGVNPRHTIGVEDSTTGATSALAAGCTTIVVKGYAPVDPNIGHAHWDGLANRKLQDFQTVWGENA